MKYEETNFTDGGAEIKMEFTGFDFATVPLDEFSRKLFNEIKDSMSVADKLLGLEHLVRKIEESGVDGEVLIHTDVIRT